MAPRKKDKRERIGVSRSLFGTPQVKELIEQGYEVFVVELDADMIFAENVWRMTPELMKQKSVLKMAMTAAKNVKKRRAPRKGSMEAAIEGFNDMLLDNEIKEHEAATVEE